MIASRPHIALTVVAALMAGLSACGQGVARPSLRAGDLDAAVAQVKAAGRPAYYLGPSMDGLPLTGLDLVEENAPAFQVEADYGTCESSGDGGCSAPVVVSTNDLLPDVRGLHCERLEPQLGVPAGVVMGELTLVTGNLVVTVQDFRHRDGSDNDIKRALQLLPHLQAVGASTPVGNLLPPDAAGTAWVDEACGTRPGEKVSHDIDATPDQPGNAAVPEFTVERLGGGSLTWAEHRGKPVVIAVGTVAQVSVAVRRLKPLLAAAAAHPTLLGLVTDPSGDKRNPRSVTDIEREAGTLPAIIGYAAEPQSAVWFLDAAANSGIQSAWDAGIIAFVDSSGSVLSFASPSAADPQLAERARSLG